MCAAKPSGSYTEATVDRTPLLVCGRSLTDPFPALLLYSRRYDGSAQFVLLSTFLRIFTFAFYTYNVCTINIRQKNTFGHWTPLH